MSEIEAHGIMLLHAASEILDIVYEEGGPADGRVILLLHGWPDDIRAWRQVAPRLHAAGYRTIAPYLRGFGPTRFLSEETISDGRGVALAQDAIDLADALGIATFAVAGHDWGARAAYTLAALFPERVTRVAGVARLPQPLAERAVRSPLRQAAESSRAHRDARTSCAHDSGSEGRLRRTRLVRRDGAALHRRYRRVLLEGVGHFPPREAPDAVADALIEHLAGK